MPVTGRIAFLKTVKICVGAILRSSVGWFGWLDGVWDRWFSTTSLVVSLAGCLWNRWFVGLSICGFVDLWVRRFFVGSVGSRVNLFDRQYRSAGGRVVCQAVNRKSERI